MIDIDQALKLVAAHAKHVGVEEAWVAERCGYVLAEDIVADVDSPPHDKALVDGYAVRVADVNDGSFANGLQVIEKVIAGAVPTKPLRPGTASQVMTGAPLPTGAEAMVMVEDTTESEGRVRIGSVAKLGQSIMQKAATFASGQQVLSRGTLIRPIEVGLLSEVGRDRIYCYARPSVAILPTGEELVPATQLPGPGQIRNSNGPMLAARARLAGCAVNIIDVARDNVDDLRSKIQEGLKSDVLILSGGVSAGVRDLVPPTLAELGVECVFHKVQLKPGKPIWFGVHDAADKRTLVFGLPGNPVSSLVCFELFVQTAIRCLSGKDGQASAMEWQPVRLATEFQARGNRPTFWPATWKRDQGRLFAHPLLWRGSSDMLTVAQADCLIYFSEGDRAYRTGEKLQAIPIR